MKTIDENPQLTKEDLEKAWDKLKTNGVKRPWIILMPKHEMEWLEDMLGEDWKEISEAKLSWFAPLPGEVKIMERQ